MNTSSPSAAVTVTGVSIALDPVDFKIVKDRCSLVTLNGATDRCKITVQFTPQATASGPLEAELVVVSTASNSPSIATLSGTAAASQPTSNLSTTSMTFIAKPGDTSVSQTVTVGNPSTDLMNLQLMNPAATVTGRFVIDNTGQTNACQANQILGPGQTCTETVEYTPGAGEANGTVNAGVLTINDNGSNAETVALSGTVVTPTSIVAPTSLTSFDTSPGFTSAVQYVVVENSPASTVTLDFSGSGTFSGPSANRFSVDNTAVPATPCVTGTSLGSSQTCWIGIVYQPGAHEASGTIDSATFTIADDGQPETVQLVGHVALVTTSLGPITSSDFGTVPAGTQSGVQVFKETNTSTDPMGIEQISSITVGGSFVLDSSSTGVPSPRCAALTTLLPTQSCNIGVRFAPGAAETGGTVDSGTLTVNSNAQNDPETLTVTGTVGATTTPISVLDKTALNYNVAPGSSKTKYVIVSNSTSSATTLGFGATVGSIAGPNAGKFSVDQSSAPTGSTACTSSTSLAPGASCSIGVKYTPGAGATPGNTHSATLTVNDNGSNVETVDLTGTVAGTPPPPVINSAVTPSSSDCGTTAVGVPSTCDEVTVKNLSTSTGNLTFSAGVVSSSNPDFTKTGGTCTSATVLAPDTTCTIDMTFTPTAGQGGTTQTGTVTVLDNDTTAQPTFGISGDVSPPPIVSEVSPSSLPCPSNTAGHTKICGSVTVTNDPTSTGSLTFDFGVISSSNPDFFRSGGTCTTSTSLAPGSSCTIQISFKPASGQSNTTQHTTIQVLDNGSQPTFTASGFVIF